VGISFRIVIIQYCIRDVSSSESIFDVDWNAVWLVIHSYMSGGGCLGQWGVLVVALAPAHVTCEQQAPFAALVNGFETGRAGVVVSLLYSGLDISLQHDGPAALISSSSAVNRCRRAS
jgi:hypothetical protein